MSPSIILGRVQMLPKGAFDMATTYSRLDCVTDDDGDYYCCTVPQVTGAKPSISPDSWDKILNDNSSTVALRANQAIDGVVSIELPATPDGDETYNYHCLDFHPNDITPRFNAGENHIEGQYASLDYDRNSRAIIWRWDGSTWRLVL